MLDHQKLVLQNVSNNPELFRKELLKSMVWLNSHEQTQLRRWLRENFWNTHKDMIKEVFYTHYDYA